MGKWGGNASLRNNLYSLALWPLLETRPESTDLIYPTFPVFSGSPFCSLSVAFCGRASHIVFNGPVPGIDSFGILFFLRCGELDFIFFSLVERTWQIVDCHCKKATWSILKVLSSNFTGSKLQGASCYVMSYCPPESLTVQDNLEESAKITINRLMIETENFSYPMKNQYVYNSAIQMTSLWAILNRT